MGHLKNICVFCGSSIGKNKNYRKQAAELGRIFAEKDYTLVYGGSNIGLMQTIADATLNTNGKVIGVMPQLLVDHEIAHQGLSEIHIVNGMAERKDIMNELSDAFIAMPGGFGTLDEIFEVIVYNQLKIQSKPIGFLNTDGYYDGILTFMKRGVEDGLLRQEHIDNIVIEDNPITLMEKLISFTSVDVEKWIDDIRKED